MLSAIIAAALLAAPASGPKPAERARANLSEYFSTDDYPITAARRGIQGTTRFRLEISSDGRVTNCTVTVSSGDQALDAATCSVLLSRAEYRPARDVQGRAIAGTDEGRVTWRLPPPEQEPFANVRAPVRIDLTVSTDAERRQTCTVLLNGRSSGADGEALCAAMNMGGNDLLMASAPANAAMTFHVAVGLENAMPTASGMDGGILIVDSAARLTVDATGRVTHCTVTATNFHQGFPAGLMTLNLCDFPAFRGKMFSAIPDSARERIGLMRMEMRIRLGPPRAT